MFKYYHTHEDDLKCNLIVLGCEKVSFLISSMVEMGSDACQETVRDPENNIELGGRGGGRQMWWLACLPVNALGRVILL